MAQGKPEEEASGVCKLCLKLPGKYTCPRCNVVYCSISCYQSQAHLGCSEAFYRDCFMEGLKDTTDGQDKQKVMEMLARLEQEAPLDSDDDDCEDLEERLQGLDLDHDSDKVWERLTDEERRAFHAMVRDGRLGNVVDMWHPWWQDKFSPVQEVDNPITPRHPPLLRNIPNLDTLLSKTPPSPAIQYTVINILYGYAYVTRLYNGNHMDHAVEAAQDLLELCGGLSAAAYQSAGEALHACLQCTHKQSKEVQNPQQYCIAVLQDVKHIIVGPGKQAPLTYIMAALSDLCRLLGQARKAVDTAKTDAVVDGPVCDEQKAERQRLYGCQKKCQFLLSWTHKFGLMLQNLIPDIDVEFCSLSSSLASHKAIQDKIEEGWGGKRPPKMHKYIEEIR